MRTALIRTLSIILAFVCGFFLPALNEFSWMIRWLIILMLFITFLGVRLTKLKPTGKHWLLIAINIAVGLGAYGVLHVMGHEELAIAAFFVGITPTATAAPVIMGFLDGSVEFVLTSLLLCNLVICLMLPFILPSIVGKGGIEIYGSIAQSVGFVMIIPALLALIVRKWKPRAILLPQKLKNVSFGAWIACLVLISAHASFDINNRPELSSHIIWVIGAISLFICAINFAIGYFIGGTMKRECSQSLGQKNTTLTIFLAMIYAPSPIAALGPTFYVLWHNLWNAWQLHRHALNKSQSSHSLNDENKMENQ